MVEVLVALAVVTISVSAVVLVAFGNQSAIVDVENHNKALQIARASLEEIKAAARADFSQVEASSATEGIFLKEILVEIQTPLKKKVTSRVSWATDPLRPQSEELVTIITDAESAVDEGGDTGGGGLSGDWRNPRTLGSVDLGAGNSATGLDVLNKIIFMSAEASSAAKPDFFIINATDGNSPFILSSLNTGPSLNAVDAAGGYAYVANRDILAQLQIINVSNLSSPSLLTSFRLPGVTGTGAVGQSIFYHDSKVYIGTKSAIGPEFHIIDVSNPSSPSAIGSREIGGDVNSIDIVGTKAYISTSLNSGEIKILDISNPQSITETGSYNAADNGDGKSIFLVENKAYLGRLEDDDEFIITDIENPGSVQTLGQRDIDDDVNGIVVRDYLAFLGTSTSNQELQILNISNPANISLWSSLNFPQIITSIDYEDNLVYAAVRSNDALRIITSN